MIRYFCDECEKEIPFPGVIQDALARGGGFPARPYLFAILALEEDRPRAALCRECRARLLIDFIVEESKQLDMERYVLSALHKLYPGGFPLV
jgi:hypothetical protein